jgi:hypothetical protein
VLCTQHGSRFLFLVVDERDQVVDCGGHGDGSSRQTFRTRYDRSSKHKLSKKYKYQALDEGCGKVVVVAVQSASW